MISPNGRYVAATGFDGASVEVTELDGDQVRSFVSTSLDGGYSEQPAAWMSDRWLAVTANGRLNLYDPAADRVVEPRIPVSGAIQVLWVPA